MNIKRTAAALAALMMCTAWLPADAVGSISHALTAHAEDGGSCGENVTWKYADGTLTISGTGPMKGYGRETAPWCSDYRETLERIVVEDGVTEIGNFAFEACESVTSVSLPESLRSIGHYAFQHCTSLESIELPAQLESVGSGAFRGCGFTSIAFPDSVKNIGECALGSCDKLTSVDLPQGITSISDHMFEGCSSLTSFVFPETVQDIGARAFFTCSALESVTLPPNVRHIGEGAFSHTPWMNDLSAAGPLVIVDNILLAGFDEYSVGEEWFGGYECPETLEIPQGVTIIADYALDALRSTALVIPESVVSIGEAAFCYSYNLKEITFPESVKEIGAEAFEYSAWIKEQREKDPLVIVNGILIDAKAANGDCVVPDGVTTISPSAFKPIDDIYSELVSVTLPESVSCIGYQALSYCGYMTDVTILNPDCVIYDEAYTICAYIPWDDSELPFKGTIHGYTGSTAEAYAQKYGYSFSSLGEAPALPAGDLDGNDVINASDAAVLLIAAAAEGASGVSPLTTSQKKAADINKDGVANASDAALILTYAAAAGAGYEGDLESYFAEKPAQG